MYLIVNDRNGRLVQSDGFVTLGEEKTNAYQSSVPVIHFIVKSLESTIKLAHRARWSEVLYKRFT